MIRLHELSANAVDSLELTATVDSALCVGAGGSSGSLADKPIVRTATGQLLIPASQLKGRLRHECEKLVQGLGWPVCASPGAATMCPQRAGLSGDFAREQYDIGDRTIQNEPRYHCIICQIFGNPSLPSNLLVDDLICDQLPTEQPEVLRPGVTINRRRQTAEDQKFFYLETSPANAQLKFKGHLHLRKTLSEEKQAAAQAILLAGLKHIHALGGSKSAGLGWLHWQHENWHIAANAWDFWRQGVPHVSN